MSLLLPQIRTGTLRSTRLVDIHGDRYVDVVVLLDDADPAQVAGRVSGMECPVDLTPGERVNLRFTMGVITRVTRG